MKNQSKSMSIAIASIAVAGVFALTVPGTFAQFTSQASSQGNAATAGTLAVQLVDSNGQATTSPVINIANAQPSMAGQTSTIRIANTGTLASDIRLYVTNLENSAANLDNVLQLTIKNSDDEVLYQGSISNLDLTISQLQAESTKVLSATVAWPDLVNVDDNPYQGATLSFEFAVDSASISA
ncbi:MAG: hypothetical protein RLZZ330_332 [Actinomycetota bacterium]|jgi:hypothetical protein